MLCFEYERGDWRLTNGLWATGCRDRQAYVKSDFQVSLHIARGTFLSCVFAIAVMLLLSAACCLLRV